jgi:hypothetical protein
MSEGSYPHGMMGRVVSGPGNLLGFILYESGLLGALGLHPRQVELALPVWCTQPLRVGLAPA